MNPLPTVQSPSNTLIPDTRPCIWCCQRLHPGVAYPAHWSSTLCLQDKQLMMAHRRSLQQGVQP